MKLTYLLGAGASAKALPVVSEFNDRLENFISLIRRSTLLQTRPVLDFDNILTEIKKHQTVDTYAKKLYLLNPVLTENQEYQKLIRLISAYFIFEQLMIPREYLNFSDVDPQLDETGIYRSLRDLYNRKREDYESLIRRIDQRYDSFFASILTHDHAQKVIIPADINIISWNYDAQLEISFMNYSKLNYEEALKDLNFLGSGQGNTFDSTKNGIVKLNGTAGFYSENAAMGDNFDFGEHQLDSRSLKIFSQVLSAEPAGFTSSLRFAWEENDISKKAVLTAQKILSESDIIVVIGYSFPYFNRKIDRDIFKNVNPETKLRVKDSAKTTKIYIQAPEPSASDIEFSFKSILSDAIVYKHTGLSQFFIPNEF